MTYGEIIKQNLQRYAWSEFAYHYTDITNAVNILLEGRLYSRNRAISKGLMRNDNAGEKIIFYNDFVKDCVRFYFRPETPTQYYNEGYQHSDFRFEQNKNANISVPIFFLFDLETRLNSGQVKFSSQILAGRNLVPPTEGVANSARLPFDKIYSTDYRADKAFMHAELIFRDEFPLGCSLRHIVCRKNTIRRLQRVQLLQLKYQLPFDCCI